MAYSKKVKDRALKLADDGNSPKKIADILSADQEFNNEKIPDERTIRGWRDSRESLETKTTPEQRELVFQHDRKVFNKLDRIMNDRNFFAYFYELSAGASIRHKNAFKLDKYLYFAYLESNKHVDKKLKMLFQTFLLKHSELNQHISSHTFISDTDNDRYQVMPYVHRQGMSSNEVNDYFNRFYELVKSTEKAYKKYRAAVRGTLYL
jgi:hypothetical protein